MKFSTAVWASGLLFGGLFVSMGFVAACGDDEPQQVAVARLARKGEACQTTNDCSPGLACIPQSTVGSSSSGVVAVGGLGVCVVGVFNVAPTSKECAVIECTAPKDCCPDNALSKEACDNYKENCLLADGGFSCQQYDLYCNCKEEKYSCDNGECSTKCITDEQCEDTPGAGGSKCLGSKCVQCAADTDCKTEGEDKELCVNGKCQAECKGDGDCPGFKRCNAGRCLDGTCQTSRECIAATRNVEATCGTDGKCIVPCQTDLECGNPKGYTFFSCINNQCTYTGCESDKDCGLMLGNRDEDDDVSRDHIVCREKTKPGPVTQPAR